MNDSGDTIMNYVILASGAFPMMGGPLKRLMDADVLVCCDGAVDELLAHRKPTYIVGDMDSISKKNLVKFSRFIHMIPNQETNDLTKAFFFTYELIKSERHPYTLTILGATGKREDHTLGNISLLLDYGLAVPCVKMISDYGTFIPVYDSCSFEIPVGSPISIFSGDSSLKISCQGLAYPTENVVFDAWWKATLNSSSEPTIRLTFNHPSKVLLYIGEKDI